MASSSHLDHTQQHPPTHTQVKHTLLSTRTVPGSQYLPSWPLVNGETELDGALLLKFTAGKLVDLPVNVWCGVVCVCVYMYVCVRWPRRHTYTYSMHAHACIHTYTYNTHDQVKLNISILGTPMLATTEPLLLATPPPALSHTPSESAFPSAEDMCVCTARAGMDISDVVGAGAAEGGAGEETCVGGAAVKGVSLQNLVCLCVYSCVWCRVCAHVCTCGVRGRAVLLQRAPTLCLVYHVLTNNT